MTFGLGGPQPLTTLNYDPRVENCIKNTSLVTRGFLDGNCSCILRGSLLWPLLGGLRVWGILGLQELTDGSSDSWAVTRRITKQSHSLRLGFCSCLKVWRNELSDILHYTILWNGLSKIRKRPNKGDWPCPILSLEESLGAFRVTNTDKATCSIWMGSDGAGHGGLVI